MQIYIPNRKYSIECREDSEDYNKNEITVLGNYSKSNYNATCIVSKYGISPTIRGKSWSANGCFRGRR